MISQKLQEAINVQIAAEMWSSNLLLIGCRFISKNWDMTDLPIG